MKPADDLAPRPRNRRTDTRDPHRAREQALRILFQAEIRGQDPLDALEAVGRSATTGSILGGEGDDPVEVDGFTRTLVAGVQAERERIDELITRFSRRWKISRMPAVDRTILRLATFELLEGTSSAAIAIDEAVGLAKAWSTDDSGRFVNGVLESVRAHLADARPDGRADGPDDEGPETADE